MRHDISSNDDIIDVRDIIERFEELDEIGDAQLSAVEAAKTDDAKAEAEAAPSRKPTAVHIAFPSIADCMHAQADDWFPPCDDDDCSEG